MMLIQFGDTTGLSMIRAVVMVRLMLAFIGDAVPGEKERRKA